MRHGSGWGSFVAAAAAAAFAQAYQIERAHTEVSLPLWLFSRRNAILADTVGFIADLPTQLVASFRATLEEVREADLILHVRDVASVEVGTDPLTEARRQGRAQV